MRTQAITAQNQPPAINPLPTPQAPWRLAGVQPLPGLRLRVQFLDGTQGEVELAPLIHAPDAGVFTALRDEAVFKQVHLEYGAACWPGELDIAPDAMYDAVKHGVPL